MNEIINPSKHSSNRFVAEQSPLPFPVMTQSRDWRQTIFNHERYPMLRKICHDRCVICGTTDWLQFERLDAVENLLGGLDGKFSFLFAGLAEKKTVAVCLDCSLESRIHFWDRRLTGRLVKFTRVNTVIFNSIQYYYALLKSEGYTKPIRNKGFTPDGSRVVATSTSQHYSQMRKLLGGKCTACSQVNHLRLDCLKTQHVKHSAGVSASLQIRFYLHQLANKNLQLLCNPCDRKKMVLQWRALGHFRRFAFGKKLVAWVKTNPVAADALEARMKGAPVKYFKPPVKNDREIINCSVHSCGHKKSFHWLAANKEKRQLWFICEDCWPDYKGKYQKLALLFELCSNVRSRKPIYMPTEIPNFDFANN